MPGSGIGDPELYYYSGNYATQMHESSTDSCGAASQEDAGVAWLAIPSLYSGPPGYSTPDFKVLSGTYTYNSGGGNSAVETFTWSFSPADPL